MLLAGLTFALLYAWPFLEARVTGDHAEHHLLDRPRQRPVRTALGAATITFYVVLFLGGAADVLAATFGLSVNAILWTFRFLVLLLPPRRGVGGVPAVQGAVGPRRRPDGVPGHGARDPRAACAARRRRPSPRPRPSPAAMAAGT